VTLSKANARFYVSRIVEQPSNCYSKNVVKIILLLTLLSGPLMGNYLAPSEKSQLFRRDGVALPTTRHRGTIISRRWYSKASHSAFSIRKTQRRARSEKPRVPPQGIIQNRALPHRQRGEPFLTSPCLPHPRHAPHHRARSPGDEGEKSHTWRRALGSHGGSFTIF